MSGMNHLGKYIGTEHHENNRKPNVVIFGSAGAGKSSLVNLLAHSNVADTSDSASGCTFDSQNYEFEKCNLWDTAGLSEGEDASTTITSSDAVAKMLRLTRNLRNGISLLIMVIQKGRVSGNEAKNFEIFWESLCSREVPVMLIITHCEGDAKKNTTLDSWINDPKNKKAVLDKFPGISASSICCVCTQYESMYESMRKDAEQGREHALMMIEHVLRQRKPPFIIKNTSQWLSRSLRSFSTNTFGRVFSFMRFAKNPKMMSALVAAGMSADEAVALANELDRS